MLFGSVVIPFFFSPFPHTPTHNHRHQPQSPSAPPPNLHLTTNTHHHHTLIPRPFSLHHPLRNNQATNAASAQKYTCHISQSSPLERLVCHLHSRSRDQQQASAYFRQTSPCSATHLTPFVITSTATISRFRSNAAPQGYPSNLYKS